MLSEGVRERDGEKAQANLRTIMWELALIMIHLEKN